MGLSSAFSDRGPNGSEPVSRVMGVGPMHDAVRTFGWSDTSLGPLEHWSDTLVANVNQTLSSPSPALLIWGDDLTLVYNEAAIPALQGKHPEALGSSHRQVYEEVWHLVGHDLEESYMRGVTVKRENMLIPLLKNGIVEEGWFTYYLIPVFENGKIVGIYNLFQNNTESVLFNRALQETKQQLQQVLDATTDAVFSLNREWDFTYLNGNAKRLLAPYGDLIGKNLWVAFPDLQYKGSPFVREYLRSMNEGLSGEFEVYYTKPEGWFQVLSRPAGDGITVFFRDITTSKMSANALIESEKLAAVGRLAASIAHEINNPLEAVTNLIYLARSDESINEETRQYLISADDELRRAVAITSSTLGFHKQATSPTEMLPSTLFKSVLTMYHGRLAKSDIVVDRRFREGRSIRCFEGEIRQVLSNLVANAIEATGLTKKPLRLRIREAHDWKTGRAGVSFTVADSGSGMSPGTLARIFEAFYTTKGVTGTGLGLWVSQEIVVRHSGVLRVRTSQQSGRSGTVFTLFLPFDAVSRSA